MKYIGIDYGTKKVGVAISEGVVALPKEVLVNDADLVSVISGYIEDGGVEAIVVGKSMTLSGGLNNLALEVEDFIKKLKSITKAEFDVYYEDERYTTKQARTLPQEGVSRGEVANKRLNKNISANGSLADAQAATIILQSFLDKQNNLS